MARSDNWDRWYANRGGIRDHSECCEHPDDNDAQLTLMGAFFEGLVVYECNICGYRTRHDKKKYGWYKEMSLFCKNCSEKTEHTISRLGHFAHDATK